MITNPAEHHTAVALVVTADALTYDLRFNEDDIADIRRVDSLHARVANAFCCLSCGDDTEATNLARSVINELTRTGEPR